MNKNEKDMNRGTLLKIALLLTAIGLLPASSAHAAAKRNDLDKYDFLMPRVKFACSGGVQWNVYPGADGNLLQELSKVVRCKTKPVNANGQSPIHGSIKTFNAVVDLTDIEQLRKYPFMFMTAEGHYDLSRRKKQNLKQYLNEGGFLLIDDCVYADGIGGGDFFYQSSCSLMRELFGNDSVKQIPKSHEVFHNVYDFSDRGLPYIQGQKHPAHGVFIEGRLAVFLSATDIHCGWAGCFGKRSRQYKDSIQMGINIIMYAISH